MRLSADEAESTVTVLNLTDTRHFPFVLIPFGFLKPLS